MSSYVTTPALWPNGSGGGAIYITGWYQVCRWFLKIRVFKNDSRVLADDVYTIDIPIAPPSFYYPPVCTQSNAFFLILIKSDYYFRENLTNWGRVDWLCTCVASRPQTRKKKEKKWKQENFLFMISSSEIQCFCTHIWLLPLFGFCNPIRRR
jgi:hypothetical protein